MPRNQATHKAAVRPDKNRQEPTAASARPRTGRRASSVSAHGKSPPIRANPPVFDTFEPRALLSSEIRATRIDGTLDVSGDSDRYPFTRYDTVPGFADSLTGDRNMRSPSDRIPTAPLAAFRVRPVANRPHGGGSNGRYTTRQNLFIMFFDSKDTICLLVPQGSEP